MQHGDLDKTKVLITQRDSNSGERKPISKVCWNLSYRLCRLVRPVGPFLDQVWSTGLVRSLTRHFWWIIWSLEFELHMICPPLHRPCPGPKPNLSTQRVSFWNWPAPVWSLQPVWWTGQTGLLWQLQQLVFLDSYKRHSTSSLVGCWFLTICILFQQPLELSLSTLCEI
jgi:hypothetical protein